MNEHTDKEGVSLEVGRRLKVGLDTERECKELVLDSIQDINRQPPQQLL